MNADFEIVGIQQATQAKVIFDSREVLWLEVEERDDCLDDCETVDEFLERMDDYWPGA